MVAKEYKQADDLESIWFLCQDSEIPEVKVTATRWQLCPQIFFPPEMSSVIHPRPTVTIKATSPAATIKAFLLTALASYLFLLIPWHRRSAVHASTGRGVAAHDPVHDTQVPLLPVISVCCSPHGSSGGFDASCSDSSRCTESDSINPTSQYILVFFLEGDARRAGDVTN